MDVGEFIGRMLYTGLRSDYIFRLWARTSAWRAISAVAGLLVYFSCVSCTCCLLGNHGNSRLLSPMVVAMAAAS